MRGRRYARNYPGAGRSQKFSRHVRTPPVEPSCDGQPFDGHLQRRTVFTQHPRDDLPPAPLEGWRRDLEATGCRRFFLRRQCPPVFDLKIEHERINLCVRPRLLPRAVDDGLALGLAPWTCPRRRLTPRLGACCYWRMALVRAFAWVWSTPPFTNRRQLS